MINTILNFFKNKPIEMICRIASLVTTFVIFSHLMKNDNTTLYLLICGCLNLIYSIYARLKLDYEKVFTKIKFFDFTLSVVNGYLIVKALFLVLISFVMFWYNLNPYQFFKFDFLLIICTNIMGLSLLMFVKITMLLNKNF